MEGEGLFGKEKVSTHGIQRTSMQREGGGGQGSINISLSRAPKSFHPQFPFISGHYSPLLSFSRCHSKHAAFHHLMKKLFMAHKLFPLERDDVRNAGKMPLARASCFVSGRN